MTNRGYTKLIEAFGKIGYELPQNPENRVTLAMLQIAQQILGREIKLNPYEKSFLEPVNQNNSEELEKINRYITLLTNAYNAGATIAIEAFAAAAGIASENAHQLALQIMKKIGRVSGK